MTIPDFQTIMLPLLKSLEDKEEHSLREVIEHISEVFSLTEEEKRKQHLSSPVNSGKIQEAYLW